MARIITLQNALPVDATAPRQLVVTFPRRQIVDIRMDPADPAEQKRLALEMTVDLMAKHQIPQDEITAVRIVSVPASTFDRLCKANSFITALALEVFGGAA